MRAFAAWNSRLPSFGELGLACFALAVISGVLLAMPFDVRAPADSVQALQIGSLPGRLLRALHGRSGDLLLLLTLLHAVEHLARGTEGLLRRGVWFRVVLSAPAVLLVMLTGFILKADADGGLARQIVAGLLERLPWIGPEAAASVVGRAGDLQLIYVHHAATATMFCWLIIIEHGRKIWPGAGALGAGALASVALAWLVPPGLHDGLDPVLKGPWYFVGLQELLHWLSRPELVWLGAALVLGLMMALRDLPRPWRGRTKLLLLLLLAAYALTSAWAQWFRGAGWRVRWPGRAELSSRALRSSLGTLSLASSAPGDVPRVLGQREGCLVCHHRVTGLAASHSPAAVGCRSCHLGDPFTLDAAQAHDGMVRVPGNLDTAALSCGQGKCHGAIVKRVGASLMATGVGLVSVDRFVFGEARTPDGHQGLGQLGRSPADLHLRGLCAPCHLGTLKHKPAPITEASRGGGCTACHLGYAPKKARYAAARARAFVHPSLTIKAGDDHCFGCHSRSGRISLNYPGWSETALEPSQVKGQASGKHRVLQDRRVLRRQPADVHHQRKMACIDCHTSRETMGDGQQHQHQEQAVEISCADCHTATPGETVGWAQLDAESRAVIKLRKAPPNRRYLLTRRSGRPLVNVTLGAGQALVLRGKLNGRRYRPRPPKEVCGAGVSGHQRLSCRSCHAAWAPQCVSCHTQYDPAGSTRDPRTGERLAGRFVEYDGEPRAGPPTLGVRRVPGSKRGTIVPFAPGMIMTLNTGRGGPAPRGKLPPTAQSLVGPRTKFWRLFAPVAPHTTAHKGRSCRSCHNDPLALGYGRGKLKLSASGPTVAWRFSAAFEPAPQDGLPADAWIGFRQTRQGPVSTRVDARPFDRQEQDRILRVGACLTCHVYRDARQRALYRDFKASLGRVSPRCLVPGR